MLLLLLLLWWRCSQLTSTSTHTHRRTRTDIVGKAASRMPHNRHPIDHIDIEYYESRANLFTIFSCFGFSLWFFTCYLSLGSLIANWIFNLFGLTLRPVSHILALCLSLSLSLSLYHLLPKQLLIPYCELLREHSNKLYVHTGTPPFPTLRSYVLQKVAWDAVCVRVYANCCRSQCVALFCHCSTHSHKYVSIFTGIYTYVCTYILLCTIWMYIFLFI